MIEPNCDMPWEIYLDWLQDQCNDDLRDINCFALFGCGYEQMRVIGFIEEVLCFNSGDGIGAFGCHSGHSIFPEEEDQEEDYHRRYLTTGRGYGYPVLFVELIHGPVEYRGTEFFIFEGSG